MPGIDLGAQVPLQKLCRIWMDVILADTRLRMCVWRKMDSSMRQMEFGKGFREVLHHVRHVTGPEESGRAASWTPFRS